MKARPPYQPIKRKNRFNAFTLAEVLITLGIIGIVAAITIPTLISNSQDRQYKIAWRKAYSELSQAVQKVYADDREILSSPSYFCNVQNNLKIIDSGLDCSDLSNITPTGKLLWHTSGTWKTKNGNAATINSGYKNNAFLMQNGTLVLFNCTKEFLVDVNGYSGPNIIGKDIFGVNISKANYPKLYFLSSAVDGTTSYCGCSGGDGVWGLYNLTSANYDSDCETGTGWGCSAKYILNTDAN